MKNIAVIIFVVLILAVLALVFASFQVRETEYALVMTFQKPPETPIKDPGWYFKWPPPIQWVHKFDSRLRILDVEMRETTVKGGVPIIVDTYIVWRIADPLQFLNAVKTVSDAERKLRQQIRDAQSSTIARHSLGEFVNSDPDKINFEQIQAEILSDLQSPVLSGYGIEITALGIKQLKIAKDTTQKVFDRMKSDRNRKTQATIQDDQTAAATIRKDADLKRAELLAAAEARAKAIRGQGDAEAAKYYKLLEKDPEFAMFLREIEVIKATLAKNSTIIIKADTEPFNLLRAAPLLTPKADPNESK